MKNESLKSDSLKRVLITGGCGFLGHHVVEHLLKNTDAHIVIMDKLTYASYGFDRLRDMKVDGNRITLISADISSQWSDGVLREIGEVECVLHLAAESHVDNSIRNPTPFVFSNVLGTQRVLDFMRRGSAGRLVYASTDEIFGSAPKGVSFKEGDTYNPGNPYAATKAAGSLLCTAYANTYGVPVIVTNTMNLFGERQHVEKFIPKVIKFVLEERELYIHANKDMTESGSRFYLHCRNYADAVMFLLENARPGEAFNIAGEREVSNLEMAQTVARLIDKPLRYKLVDFHSSRPGHDLRYALDDTKITQRGWVAPVSFDASLEKTVKWYLKPENEKWLRW